jgi:ABC-type sulfate/molybdate transport systems ATPase subunit
VDTLQLDLSVRRRHFDLELTLDVEETLALVGPSGAGKTTLLRTVAGLVRGEGRVTCGGERWLDSAAGIDLPPEQRAVGLVFQEYALFPHLSVRENVAFGGVKLVPELLERFGLARLAAERPPRLSGGERQRVALARALAREPKTLLLDEPLGALDANTRRLVRGELRRHLHEARLPTLVVTHDYEDAAALAGRIGVIADGRVVQLGAPDDLLAQPASEFVADFVGSNFVEGTARPGVHGLTEVVLPDGIVVVSTAPGRGRVGVVVSPWDIALARDLVDDSMQNHVRATVTSVVNVGNRVRVRLGPLTAEVTRDAVERLGVRDGERLVAGFKATATRLVPLDGR